ncbi:MAG: 16S rRNA (guanine(966)-N(2))-methyltransferase RsmD, partial [Microbacteriaceae bacterium]|nr:16S rRNA (guanine(966)-N(2))-methyltransferase RsmD [Microbacteriaceae bacterium]
RKMTRIIAGSAGSLRLAVPPRGTRPTSDRVREAIFSTLDAWDFITGTRVLDLYAGSGALGLEALSRGAVHATLVEKHSAAAAIARKNSELVVAAVRKNGGQASAEVAAANVQSWLEMRASQAGLAESHELYDVALIDPPYDFSEETITANLASLLPLLAPNAAVMVERDKRSPAPTLPVGYRHIKVKNYGETSCYWLEPDAASTI